MKNRAKAVASAMAVLSIFTIGNPLHADILPPGAGGTNSGPTYVALNSWSFHDPTNWTSDNGHLPVSFSHLGYSYLGNGSSLVVDSTNPARLQYHVLENDGTTNLTVDSGSVVFWFAPSSWSSTNQGGTGPGEYGRLLEVGGYTADSSFGWWSLYVSADGNYLYFSTQTNDLSSSVSTYLAAPIAWKTNYFHQVALTYSATNTALYVDGGLATNGPPLTVYPGPNALANGFFIGSDSNGVYQAHGLFNDVATYNVPLDAGTIQQMFSQQFPYYLMNPLDTAMFTMTNALSWPSYTNGYEAISGAGNLQEVSGGGCDDGTNALVVWFTNVTATTASDGTMNVQFTITGGMNGYPYDVFATAYLQAPITDAVWVWLGQGYRCTTYTVNIPSANAYLILGTPQDSNGDGVSDAYSLLVAHLDPTNQVQTADSYGVPYAWYVQNGLDPQSALQDPDGDALLNYQEYLYGTKPEVSEGFSIWAAVNGTTVIP